MNTDGRIVNTYSSTEDKIAIMQDYINGKEIYWKYYDEDSPQSWEPVGDFNKTNDDEIWDFDHCQYVRKGKSRVFYVCEYRGGDFGSLHLTYIDALRASEGWSSQFVKILKVVEVPNDLA